MHFVNPLKAALCDLQHAASLTVGAAATETPGLRRSNSASRLAAAALLQAAARRERRNSFSEIYSWEGLQVTLQGATPATHCWLASGTAPSEIAESPSFACFPLRCKTTEGSLNPCFAYESLKCRSSLSDARASRHLKLAGRITVYVGSHAVDPPSHALGGPPSC